MHVAILSHTYVEPANRGKLEALARADVAVTAYVPAQWHESALRRRWHVTHEQHSNLEIIPVPVRRLLGTPAAAWWDLSMLRKHLAQGRHELLHVEEEPWSLVSGAALAAAQKHNVPSVIFTWQNLPHHPRWPLSAVRRRTLRRAGGWMAGNAAAGRLLQLIDDTKPLLTLPQLGVRVSPGVRPPREQRGPLSLAYVGRLVPEKGVAQLLSALEGLDERWHLTIAGDGPDRDRLQAQVRDLPNPSRVTFLGAVPHSEVEQLWSSVDVLVLFSQATPTWAEQFGHVLVEALAHGVAVVGSSCGAIPEVIGDAGVVVPEGHVGELRLRLQELAVDRGRLDELSRRGLARAAERYANEIIAKSSIAFWKLVRGHCQALKKPRR